MFLWLWWKFLGIFLFVRDRYRWGVWGSGGFVIIIEYLYFVFSGIESLELNLGFGFSCFFRFLIVFGI